MTPLQQQTPPDKRGPLFEVWLAKQPIANATEVRVWVERVAAEGVRRGKKV